MKIIPERVLLQSAEFAFYDTNDGIPSGYVQFPHDETKYEFNLKESLSVLHVLNYPEFAKLAANSQVNIEHLFRATVCCKYIMNTLNSYEISDEKSACIFMDEHYIHIFSENRDFVDDEDCVLYYSEQLGERIIDGNKALIYPFPYLPAEEEHYGLLEEDIYSYFLK